MCNASQGGVLRMRTQINGLRGIGDFFRAQELCENRGGRPGLPSLINLRFLWT